MTRVLEDLLMTLAPEAQLRPGTSIREQGKHFAVRPAPGEFAVAARLDHSTSNPGQRRVDGLFACADQEGLLVLLVELKGGHFSHAQTQHDQSHARLCARRDGRQRHRRLHAVLDQQGQDALLRGSHPVLYLTVSTSPMSQHQRRKKAARRKGRVMPKILRPRKQPWSIEALRSLGR